MDNMARIEKIVAGLPEAERVDVAEWGDHPTFRVRGKNFIFTDQAASAMSGSSLKFAWSLSLNSTVPELGSGSPA